MNLITKIYENLPIEAKKIRIDVFVKEQGFNEEFDTYDKEAIHIVIFDNDKEVATSRVIYSKEHHSYLIGRVAVRKEYRNKQLGSLVMKAAEEEIIKRFGHIIIGVSAQERVASFYKKIGYIETKERYLDENCPHVWMIKQL